MWPCTNKYRDRDGNGEAWPILVACVLEPLEMVIWGDILGGDKLDKLQTK